MKRRVFNRLTLAVAVLLFTSQARSARPQPDSQRLFAALALMAGATVGEIGAGKGELALAAAHVVGATGKVLASELGEKRVRELEGVVSAAALPQLSVVAGSPTTTSFPDACCDAIFMHDVYHHFTEPAAMNASILRSLKPGGRLAIVDFTPPPDSADVPPADRAKDGSHGVRPATLRRELTEAGFGEISVDSAGDRWFLVVARKP